MNLEKIELGKLKPVDYNPRTITGKDFGKLLKNLEEFGLVDPIVINIRNNHIIGGHQRYFAIEKKFGNIELDLLKIGDIGWVFFNKDLNIKSEDYEKALNISLNKLSGDWDIDKLSELLDDIENSEFDNDLTGFKPHEFELYDDGDIVLKEGLFHKNTSSSYAIETIVCPKCTYEFIEN